MIARTADARAGTYLLLTVHTVRSSRGQRLRLVWRL
jgi:hypothetical protein